MSPETFTEHVRSFCQWAESDSHDLETVHHLLLSLMEGAPGLKTSRPIFTEPVALGLPQEVVWRDTKRFADFPFQCYYPVLWPETHPEGQFTDNIHEDFAHIYAELRHGLEAVERSGFALAGSDFGGRALAPGPIPGSASTPGSAGSRRLLVL